MLEIQEVAIQKVNSQLCDTMGVELWIKREDEIHSEISGNKWRKLKYNLLKAQQENRKGILTFGGAFSNHIVATAAAGKEFNIPTIGIIRGEELNANSNATLKRASELGMKLIFVSRDEYSDKEEFSYKQMLYTEFGNVLVIPEGGSNFLGISGCSEILDRSTAGFNSIVVACGTGSTLTGIVLGLKENQRAVGIPVLKGEFMQGEVEKQLYWSLLDKDLVSEYESSYQLINDYHFGGYAKWNNELIEFIQDFNVNYGIKLDPIYTGKMMFGVMDLIEKGFFKRGEKVLAIHTGGLQGITGFEERNELKVY